MARKSRRRGAFKWIGLGMTLIVLAACGLQGSRGVGFTITGRTVAVDADVYRGAIHITVAYLSEAHTRLVGSTGFHWVDARDRDHQWARVRYYASFGVSSSPVRLSMIWVLLLVGIPTGLRWYRDRRPPIGHCTNCGYDLTGNVSGRCPECGEAVANSRGRG